MTTASDPGGSDGSDRLARAYAEASRFLAETVAAVPDGAWERPGLGTWSVRELVAHANRAHTTVEDYLLHPQPAVAPDDPYFAPEAIAQRARDGVAALGDDPAAAVAATSRRVVALVAATDPDATLGSPAGSMPLSAYLPSRVAELVVHGADLAAAIGLEPQPPAEALTVALEFLTARAAQRDPLLVVRALTGRGTLPNGYSVY